MIVNRGTLLQLAPIKDMLADKVGHNGVSHGLGEAGYDIRIKQEIRFQTSWSNTRQVEVRENGEITQMSDGRFSLASAIEEFQMPNCLTGVVHDKSTWARRGLSVFNTVIEPGWNGFLTLELVYHGNDELIIPAGSGIAQVLFHHNTDTATYTGRYQDQEDAPVAAKDWS